MAGVIREYVFDNFSGGMASAVDPSDMPKNMAQECHNVDGAISPGRLRKAPGTQIYDFNGLLSNGKMPQNEKIISLHAFVYNEVWVGSEKVNRMKELVIIQVDGVHGLDWYELERTVGQDNWVLSDISPYYCGWDSAGTLIYSAGVFKGEYGVTRAGKVRWLEHGGILRAACGAFVNTDVAPSHPMFNKSDSFPIQWRYVNLWPIAADDPDDNRGMFKVFDYTSAQFGQCKYGEAGLWRGRSLPDYTPPLVITSFSTGQWAFDTYSNYGYLETAYILYAVLAEYDGHQIATLKSIPLESSHFVHQAGQAGYHSWTTKFKISIPKTANVPSCPDRLTALRVYRAPKLLGLIDPESPGSDQEAISFNDYDMVLRLGMKDGMEGLFGSTGAFSWAGGYWTIRIQVAASMEWYNANPSVTNLWQNMFVRFKIGDDYREYKIYDSLGIGHTGELGFYTDIRFAASYEAALDGTRPFTINARWYEDGTNYSIVFVDPNIVMDESPSWLVPDIPLSKMPKIECNYSKATVFKDRMLVWDVAYDDELKPKMLRYSYPINSIFAGFDIQPNFLNVPFVSANQIMGVHNYLDFALVFGKEKAYKYLILDDGISQQLIEFLWEGGIESMDSVCEIDGIIYFLGRLGSRKSLYRWIPSSGKWEDLGDRIKPTLDDFEAIPNMRFDLAVGLFIPHEKKYLLNMPVMSQ